MDRNEYGYANSPGYSVVLNRTTGEPIVAVRTRDNTLLLNRNLFGMEDKLLRAELRVELGGNCEAIEDEDFAVDVDTGVVYIGEAARSYWELQLEGKQLN